MIVLAGSPLKHMILWCLSKSLLLIFSHSKETVKPISSWRHGSNKLNSSKETHHNVDLSVQEVDTLPHVVSHVVQGVDTPPHVVSHVVQEVDTPPDVVSHAEKKCAIIAVAY